jgi:hypothetical protein
MMFIMMFIIQYVFMSYIMTNRIDNITNSIGKVYISTLMGLIMVFYMNLSMNLKTFINRENFIYIGLICIVIYLYKTQVGINDAQYLQEMIEHHSMALLTSENILKKTNNNYVADIAQRIRNTQEKEIAEMRNIIKLL